MREFRHVQFFFDTYQIEHFSLLNERVEAVHHFLDGSLPVPPVHVKNVDVRRPQLLQAGFYAEVHRLGVVSGVEDLLFDPSLRAHVVRCVLCA